MDASYSRHVGVPKQLVTGEGISSMSLQLTAELYHQILDHLRCDAPSRSSDKRSQGRVGLRCSLQIAPVAQGNSQPKPFVVWVRDISMKGIGLVTSTPIAENTSFSAQFAREQKQDPLSVTYKVVYCRRLSSDLYSVGAILEEVLKKESNPSDIRVPASAVR
jgi:hypothetical protein